MNILIDSDSKQLAFDSTKLPVEFLKLYPALKLVFDWNNNHEVFYFKTSGSTGIPKTIQITRKQIIDSANNIAKMLSFKKSDFSLLCLNENHIGGAMVVFRALIYNQDLYICKPQAKFILEFLSQNKHVTHASFSSNQLYRLIFELDGFELLNSIENILIGGSSISIQLEDELKKLKGNVYHTFGMTETVSNFALRNVKKQNKLFQAYSDVIIQTDDDKCLCIKGNITNNLWVNSNDIVNLVDSNSFEFIGRKDNVINTGGVKISPELVEKKLSHQLLNTNFIISSMPDEVLNEKLVLVIEGNRKFNVDFSILELFERPKMTIFLDEFPLTSSNKIKRNEIKQIINSTINNHRLL